ncbi:MAG TPA: branched-chain amino acid ABC transporter permease, partial [Streptosporangiaceae bacterium]|nr:branched-chain amino acid ABC transporter permease [Streptosporangiaceae bacterium]
EDILASGGPQIGADEWVARHGQRQEQFWSTATRLTERVGWWPRLAVAGAIAAILPAAGLGGFQLQVGVDSLVIALLAVGLNVVVGWTGVLDLGYVAYFGVGAYGYALVSSAQVNIHIPAYLSLPGVMVAAALIGIAIGLPSQRLVGDYLAIVTLFFGEAFVEFTNNVAPTTLGGANGISGIDPVKGLGVGVTNYYYLLVVVLVLVIAALHLLEHSRTGRAWRAVREDPLAAASMTMPVRRLRLSALATGAAIAALAGGIFGAQLGAVFPTNFDTPVLILVYAGLILGGSGSLPGAAIGALVVMITYDGLLRGVPEARGLFYGVIAMTLIARLRPWSRLAAVLVATGVLGAAAWAAGHAAGFPSDPRTAGNWGFVILIVAVIGLVQVRPAIRTYLIPPVLVLAAFTWENRLVNEPSITRQLLIGAILMVMMIARPQGLFGQQRVEAPL